MRFRLIWRPAAENALIEIWLSANDRSLVTETVKQLEDSLKRNPHVLGESRGEISRLVISGSIAISVQIDDEDGIVYVEEIWRIR